MTLTKSWDVYLIQNLVENRKKQQELTQVLEKNLVARKSRVQENSANMKNLSILETIVKILDRPTTSQSKSTRGKCAKQIRE
ncbi:4939_t:CDS:2 [Gigaspora rosea]|nr:4939_t:CDS:2 [Gigaspora rosea]